MKTKAKILSLLLAICLVAGLMPMTAFAGGTGRFNGPTKAFVKAVFSDTVEAAGADGLLAPQAGATRAQAATLLMRFLER